MNVNLSDLNIWSDKKSSPTHKFSKLHKKFVAMVIHEQLKTLTFGQMGNVNAAYAGEMLDE
jgi:hypothetical protein